MNITHDRSYLSPGDLMWTQTELAEETVYSLRFSYRILEEDRRREELACLGKSADEQRRIRTEFVLERNSTMHQIMDRIAGRFVVYQYGEEDPAPYNSALWEFFFWCNTQEEPPYERDYSYFTLTLNEMQPPDWRLLVCKHLLDFLQDTYAGEPHLDVAVQYTAWYDMDRIRAETLSAREILTGHKCTFQGKKGKLVPCGDRLQFKPSRARTRTLYVSEKELLEILWSLESAGEKFQEQVHEDGLPRIPSFIASTNGEPNAQLVMDTDPAVVDGAHAVEKAVS